MDFDFEECPFCNNKVLKGAMRCVACGKILQTKKERLAIIEKFNAKPKTDLMRIIKLIIKIIIIGVLYYFYYEKTIEIIKNIK